MKKLTIRVNGYPWDIVFTSDNKNLIDRNGHICKGLVSYKEKIIYVDRNVPREDIKHILKHELTHIYLYKTQLYVKETFSEEDICEFVAIYGSKIHNKVNNIMKRI